MQYLENKAALNEALERLNWPISLKELSMLENEILAGKMYVQQAMELQEAVKKENYVSKALEEVCTMAGSVFAPSLPLRALDVSAGRPSPPLLNTLISKSYSQPPEGLRTSFNRKEMVFDFTLTLFFK